MLIIVYIATILLVFTGFQPLVITAVFSGICYLPGCTLFTFCKKDGLTFDDLILSFPVSIGISSLLLVFFLLTGGHVKLLLSINLGIIGLSIFAYIMKYKKLPSSTVRLAGTETKFIIIAIVITALFSIPVISERIAISAHGFHHSAITTQIVNGIFPPENPGMGGTPLGYHWGFHAFVAAISSQTGLPPLRVISVLNVISLFFIFCIAYRCSEHLEFSEGHRYLVPLALIGLMRFDAVLYLSNKIFALNLISLRDVTFPEVRPSEILQSWIWGGGAPWFDRRLFFLNKFYNANTMPVGIALCLSYFMFLLSHIRRDRAHNGNTFYMIIFGLLILAGCIIYPPLAIIPLLHAPLWGGVTVLSGISDLRLVFKEALTILIPYSVAVLVALPYLLAVSGSTGEPVISIHFYDQSLENLAAFWLPMPFILAGIVISYERLSRNMFCFMGAATLLCFSLSVFTRVALDNSTKFSFILSFFYAVYFVIGVSALLNAFSSMWMRRLLSLCVIVALMATPVITTTAYILSPWFDEQTYSFSGRHVVFGQDRERNEAYEWIRSTTPSNSLVMLTYIETENPDMIAQNSTYEAAAMTERNLFVVKDWYTLPDSEYEKRVKIRQKVISGKIDSDVRKYFTPLNRSVYLLVEEDLPSMYQTDEIFQNFPDKLEGLVLVFKNNRQKVYLVTL